MHDVKYPKIPGGNTPDPRGRRATPSRTYSSTVDKHRRPRHRSSAIVPQRCPQIGAHGLEPRRCGGGVAELTTGPQSSLKQKMYRECLKLLLFHSVADTAPRGCLVVRRCGHVNVNLYSALSFRNLLYTLDAR